MITTDVSTTIATGSASNGSDSTATTGCRRLARSLAVGACGLFAAGAFTVAGGSGPAAAEGFSPIDVSGPSRLGVSPSNASNQIPTGGLTAAINSGALSPSGGDGTPVVPPLGRIDVPGITLPEGPEVFIPGDFVPPSLCAELETDWLAAVHTFNGDGTVTATLGYTGPADPCDTLIVVQSLALNSSLEFVSEVLNVLVPIGDLAAAPEGTMDVVVPIDWCYARVLTNVEGLPLDDDTYIVETPASGDFPGCGDAPTETTMPTDTPDETVPEETPDPTTPPSDTRPPVNTIPEGQLPQTGAESTVLAVVGGAFVILGGTLAGMVRGFQRRS